MCRILLPSLAIALSLFMTGQQEPIQAAPSVAAWADCGWIDTLGCPNNSHRAWADVGGNASGTHQECKTCPLGESCHGSCWPEEEEEDLQLAYLDATRAVQERDLQTLMDLAPRLADYLTLNVSRSAMQLWSCDGGFVQASLQVPEGLWSEVQQLRLQVLE